MKKTLLVAGSCLVLLSACGNKGVALEGTWKEHQRYFNNKKKDTGHCLPEYEKVIFTDDNKVEMDDVTYEYKAEQKDDKTEITTVDNTTNETKHYEIKELKNGNILMGEKDGLSACELKKTE